MINCSHLEGKKFNHGVQDCLTAIQEVYRDVFNIVLPNPARADEWWNHGQSLYEQYYHSFGFRIVDQEDQIREGDVILMAIDSEVPNHGAVYLGEGKIYHHFYGRLSKTELYNGIWRRATVAIIRHKDLRLKDTEVTTVNILDLLPPSVREKFENDRRAAVEASRPQ